MKQFLHVLSLAALISIVSAANATSSTNISPVSSTSQYWSCTNTYVVRDPSNSGWWYANANGGEWGRDSNADVYCYNAGSNPPNSIPFGISIWYYTGPNGPSREYYKCSHLAPSCGWISGNAPNTRAP